MSENTNTLFWVITGAVIVVAIFGIVSYSNNTSVRKIFNEIGSYFNSDVSTNTPSVEQTTPDKVKTIIDGNWKYEMTVLSDSSIQTKITNIGSETITNVMSYTFYLYEKGTDNLILSMNEYVGKDIQPNKSAYTENYYWDELKFTSIDYDFDIKVIYNNNPLYNYNGEMVTLIHDLGDWEFSAKFLGDSQMACKIINTTDHDLSFTTIKADLYIDNVFYTNLEFGSYQDYYSPRGTFEWHSYFGVPMDFDNKEYRFEITIEE